MDVRAARPGDAWQIAVVHVRSWQQAYRGLLPQDYLDRLDPGRGAAGWESALRRADGQRTGVLVAGDDAGLAGFVSFSPTRDGDEDPGRVGEVQAIYVLPGRQRSGLGRQLLEAATGQLASAGFGQATLWVLDTNAGARRFYEACGWSADGCRKDDDSLGFRLTEVRYRRPLP